MKDGVAKDVEEEEYLDDHGNVVNKFNNTKLGNNTRFRMLYPRYRLFVDEVGSNKTHREGKVFELKKDLSQR